MSTFTRAFAPLLGMLALIACAFIVTPFNPLLSPNPPLDGGFANIMLIVTESGNKYILSFICLLMLLIILARPDAPRSQRLLELLSLPLALLLLLGAGSMVNEKFLKPHFAYPRPNIVELARTPPTAPLLGMPAATFYQRLSRVQRRTHLEHVLSSAPSSAVPMSAEIRRHWAHTVGYSFPSGHAFSASATATFFFLFGIRHLSGWRLRICYLLLPWAVLVAYSRPVLRVHTPADILVGAILGVTVSSLVYVVWRSIAHRLAQSARTRT